MLFRGLLHDWELRADREVPQKCMLAAYLPGHQLEVREEAMSSTFRDFAKTLESSKTILNAQGEEQEDDVPGSRIQVEEANPSSVELRARGFKSSEGLVRFKPTHFGFSKTKGFVVKEEIPELQFSVRLQRTCDERFNLCVPRVKIFAKTSVIRACAIDPGVWCFITMYDRDGLTLGVDDMKECIFRRCLTIDRLISRRTKEPSKYKHYRMGKRLEGSFRRERALVADMHHKVPGWPSTNYNEVRLSSFKMAWSHYKFEMLLS